MGIGLPLVFNNGLLVEWFYLNRTLVFEPYTWTLPTTMNKLCFATYTFMINENKEMELNWSINPLLDKFNKTSLRFYMVNSAKAICTNRGSVLIVGFN